MNRPEVYHKSVQILYDAYFNDTLEHGNYCGCAVGNLIAANMGICLTAHPERKANRVSWGGDLEGGRPWFETIRRGNCLLDEGRRQINSTGYKVREVCDIEAAFEQAEYDSDKDVYMFNGLVAVLEVLKEIHEVEDADLIQSNHNRFKEHHERKLQTV